ncbi:MAG: peptidoglycan DD-metalloendopeptidase family protein [Actinomycetota bacterium]|nr:peptidoglycan DD-metalloendopeptidase family protein [Actinomycetota bacterium]
MRVSTHRRALFVLLILALMIAGLAVPASAETDGAPGADPSLYAPPFAVEFPLEGSYGFSDSFGAIRSGGSRLHQGNDISAPKTTPVLAAAAGVVSRIDVGPLAGLYVDIEHAEGWHTRYLHLNDEEPPPPPVAEPICETVTVEDEVTEDSAAEDKATDEATSEDAVGEEAPTEVVVCVDAPVVEEPLTWGIPPEVSVGAKVAAGDVIGFVGTSGNASSTAPHLHFEVRMPNGTPVNPYPLLTGKTSSRTLYVLPDVTDDPITASIDVIGHLDPTSGFNTDIWVHSGVAYLGTFGSGETCPAAGVRRYDVTNPSAPLELVPISEDYPGTSTDAVWAGSVETEWFAGDIAIVAHQPCDPDDREAFRGFVLYDVTDPSLSVQLGTYETGTGTMGVSGFDVWVGEERTLVVAATPNSFLDHPDALGDVRIVDVTDPGNPMTVADWDYRRDVVAGDLDPWGFALDALVTFGDADFDEIDPRDLHAQSITMDPDGERAFVAYWDAGVVILDLSEPSQPETAGLITSPGYEKDESYSTAFGSDSGVLVVNHRDLDPLGDDDTDGDEAEADSWGISVVFDLGGRSDRSLAAIYSIEDALPDTEGRLALDGKYAPQETVVAGDYLYAVWLSGGLRVMDLSEPAELVEVASFVPPTRVDPQRHFTSPNGNIAMPLAWSVHVVDNLIYVSDANTGLWILRLSDPPLGTD